MATPPNQPGYFWAQPCNSDIWEVVQVAYMNGDGTPDPGARDRGLEVVVFGDSPKIYLDKYKNYQPVEPPNEPQGKIVIQDTEIRWMREKWETESR